MLPEFTLIYPGTVIKEALDTTRHFSYIYRDPIGSNNELITAVFIEQPQALPGLLK